MPSWIGPVAASMIDYAKVEEQERSPMIEYLLKLYIDLTARPTELGRDAN
jgi:hypothetical protein